MLACWHVAVWTHTLAEGCTIALYTLSRWYGVFLVRVRVIPDYHPDWVSTSIDGPLRLRMSRALVPVKTAMKKEQVRERERARRKTRCCARFTRKKSSYRTPLPA